MGGGKDYDARKAAYSSARGNQFFYRELAKPCEKKGFKSKDINEKEAGKTPVSKSKIP